jgi:hypothetical protein
VTLLFAVAALKLAPPPADAGYYVLNGSYDDAPCGASLPLHFRQHHRLLRKVILLKAVSASYTYLGRRKGGSSLSRISNKPAIKQGGCILLLSKAATSLCWAGSSRPDASKCHQWHDDGALQHTTIFVDLWPASQRTVVASATVHFPGGGPGKGTLCGLWHSKCMGGGREQ